MMFTPGQFILLAVVTEFFVYLIVVNITNTIKHCATAKFYEQYLKKLEEYKEDNEDEEQKNVYYDA